jgi:hypothetical protein
LRPDSAAPLSQGESSKVNVTCARECNLDRMPVLSSKQHAANSGRNACPFALDALQKRTLWDLVLGASPSVLSASSWNRPDCGKSNAPTYHPPTHLGDHRPEGWKVQYRTIGKSVSVPSMGCHCEVILCLRLLRLINHRVTIHVRPCPP